MKVSVVTTLYYSEPYINEFFQRIKNALEPLVGESYEVIFVNDGPTDGSILSVRRLIEKALPMQVQLIELSRNFGHHKAMLTGLRLAKGDFVFLIDIDLEEPPELFTTFWEKIHANSDTDVVYGIQTKRKGNYFEKYSGAFFYHFFNWFSDIKYPHNTTTARLMRKDYVQAVLEYPEKELEIWGVFVLSGFNQVEVPVIKGYKGSTTYSIRRKLSMAIQTITSFSTKPLYLIFLLGIVMAGIASASLIFIFINKLIYGDEIEGWASILGSVWIIGGLLMSSIGVIGLYLSKIFLEVKDRPLTHIKSIYYKKE